MTTIDGHWETADGARVAAGYVSKTRGQLAGGHISDFALANAVFMANRNSLDLIAMQTAAKDRIRWLSVQLAIANAEKVQIIAYVRCLPSLPDGDYLKSGPEILANSLERLPGAILADPPGAAGHQASPARTARDEPAGEN